MKQKNIKRIWPFQYYDYDLIIEYLNNKANHGEALEYIGSIFATFKKTQPNEYKYCVDFQNELYTDTEEFQVYKKKWEDNGWEYVDYYESLHIFRCKTKEEANQSYNTYNAQPIRISEVRENIFKKLSLNWKKECINATILIIVFIISFFFNHAIPKACWAMAIIVQMIQLSPMLGYLGLRRKRQDEYVFCYDKQLVESGIRKSIILAIIKQIILFVFILMIVIFIIAYEKSSFGLICIIVATVFILGSNASQVIKRHNEKSENKINFESTKSKIIVITIGMILIIVVMVSCVMLDQSKDKPKSVKNIPNVVLNCDDRDYFLFHDYGQWEYGLSGGISTGFEYEFSLIEPEEIKNIIIGENKEFEINVLENPNHVEVRYWSKEKFNKLKSYDEGYKLLPIENNTFTVLDEDMIYVIYSTWDEEDYKGTGYYVFTAEIE